MKLSKDSNGDELRDGDLITFSYGIPPVGVVARLVDRDGHLFALTPGHNPAECRLDRLKRYVHDFYKTMPVADAGPDEIEAKLFAGRLALRKEAPDAPSV